MSLLSNLFPDHVIADLHVLSGTVPARLVVHDRDGEWAYFAGDIDPPPGDPDLYTITPTAALIAVDPTLADLPPLEPGYAARRGGAAGALWRIEPYAYPEPSGDEDPAELVERLRAGAETLDSPHIEAAVGLICEDGYWLGRPDFVAACVLDPSPAGGTHIRWSLAQELLETTPEGDPKSRAVLDFAIALATNRYLFSRLDDDQAETMTRAILRAINPLTVPKW